jgi:four helix bundle protein
MASLKLEELVVYTKGMEIGEAVWTIVEGWNHFQQNTIGRQRVKSADSIAANIAEG